jgi:XRE family transcriptional regulator, fatty acid utilization regulator
MPVAARRLSRLIYGAAMDLEKTEGTPIGVNDRVYERENRSRRAEPPITCTLILDENTRRGSSFAFFKCKRVVRGLSCPEFVVPAKRPGRR